MKPKISLITLGVSDLKKSTEFYKKLGFPLNANSNDNVSFFALNGTWLGLFSREELAKDATVSSKGDGFSGVTLAHNVRSEKEVDDLMRFAVEEAGAKLVKPAQKVFWGGYSGYFSDPDGYLWEVAFNPFMDLT